MFAMNSCRICRNKCDTDDLNNLFVKGFDQILPSAKISYCTGLAVTPYDKYPKWICHPCLEDLHIAYNFKKKSHDSYQKFRAIIMKKNIEKESEDDQSIQINQPEQMKYKSEMKTVVVKNIKCKKEVETNRSQSVNETHFNFSLKKIKKEPSSVITNEDIKPEFLYEITPKNVKYEMNSEENSSYIRDHTYSDDFSMFAPSPKMKRHSCRLCKIVFDSQEELQTHKSVSHARTFVCELCGKTFKTSGARCGHMAVHRSPRFHCDHCDYKTVYRNDIVKHLNKHFGIRNFACKLCDSTFIASSNLSKHVKNVHIGIRSFLCRICNKGFKDKRGVELHEGTHGGARTLICEICDSSFRLRKNWIKHMLKIHKIVVPKKKSGKMAFRQMQV